MEISISELVGIIRDTKPAQPDAPTAFWEIGKAYFIRTVTHHYTGVCEHIGPQEIVLSKAAWIADDGRFAQAVATGVFSEVEPFPSQRRVLIGRASVLDAVEITTIPTSQK